MQDDVAECFRASPLMRGEWIEIVSSPLSRWVYASPLMRGEWIEMAVKAATADAVNVSPHARGVD